ELDGPERLDLFEPLAQRREPLGLEAIDANARVVVLRRLDDPALAQHAEVAAHRRPARAERVCDIARAARLATPQFDHAAARGIGERDKRLVEIRHGFPARLGLVAASRPGSLMVAPLALVSWPLRGPARSLLRFAEPLDEPPVMATDVDRAVRAIGPV